MAELSFSEMSQMQKDAVERILEMRKRAQLAAEDAAVRFCESSQKNTSEISKENTNDCPKNVPFRDNSNSSNVRKVKQEQCNRKRANGQCCRQQNGKTDLFSRLFSGKGIRADDSDNALLLSLCFLLQSEKADEELMLALLYLMI